MSFRKSLFIFAVLAQVGCVINTPKLDIIEAAAQIEKNNEKNNLKNVKEVRIYNSNFIMQSRMDKKIQANVTYTDGTIDQNLIFYSSDDTILHVDSLGKVTAIKEGVATIVAQSVLDSAKKSVVTVTVKPENSTPTIAYIEPDNAIVEMGQTLRLSARIQMSNGENSPNVIWRSDNESIAVVNNGLVTGIRPGSTRIHAEALSDPSKKTSARINVVFSPTIIER